MTEAQEVRMRAYLNALRPQVANLRARGWPVEISVDIEGEGIVISARLNIDDTRLPIEAGEK